MHVKYLKQQRFTRGGGTMPEVNLDAHRHTQIQIHIWAWMHTAYKKQRVTLGCCGRGDGKFADRHKTEHKCVHSLQKQRGGTMPEVMGTLMPTGPETDSAKCAARLPPALVRENIAGTEALRCEGRLVILTFSCAHTHTHTHTHTSHALHSQRWESWHSWVLFD